MNKLYLLMEKQHNRGQDGAGVASIKLNLSPGYEYLDRMRSADASAIHDIFQSIRSNFTKTEKKSPGLLKDISWAKKNLPFAGELLLGHLRYGTFGKNRVENAHPVVRQNNWKSRTLVLAGNFNLTNVDDAKSLVSGNTTYNNSNEYVFNFSDITISDSGVFNITAICTDETYVEGNNFSTWSIEWAQPRPCSLFPTPYSLPTPSYSQPSTS